MAKRFFSFGSLLLLWLSALSALQAQSVAGLFISEYIEGTSNNKAIELYNPTNATIDLTAGNYLLQMYFNGFSTPGNTIALTGTIPANGNYVIAHGSASFIAANGGTVVPNITNAGSWYNGDDAIALRKGGATGDLLDVIGQVGLDPGIEWGTGIASTADNTLRRRSALCTGDVNLADTFVPTAEWEGFATDAFDGLGSHTSSCFSTPVASIHVSPTALTFSASLGVPSIQFYLVDGEHLTSDVSIVAPASFGVSTSKVGPFASEITLAAAIANAGDTIFVQYDAVAAGTHSGSIALTTGAVTASVAVTGSTTNGVIPIYSIQGTTNVSPYKGQIVTTSGVVVADFQEAGQLNGFYIQDLTGDGNTATSDGIFVLNTTLQVNVGDRVTLTGEVDEYFQLTELKNITSLNVNQRGSALPVLTDITLPVSSIGDLEKYEGMYVRFPQTLTATEVYTLGRYGEVALSVYDRLYNPTNFVDLNDAPASGTTSIGTGNLAAVLAQQDLNTRSRILLDDASNVQNPAIVPYLNPVDTTLRVGSTISNVTGILEYAFNLYRIQPTVAPNFEYAPRPAVPSLGGANLKVASFNVLNYFNGDGVGGGFPTARGANTLVEFNRQRKKIIAAIKEMDADVIGLIEMENDGDGANSAIANLVNGLNAATAAGTYAYVLDPTGANGNSGTDAIKQAILYKPAKVAPVGASVADMHHAHNRPPIAQTFTLNSNGEKFTVIVNHFKSKSCTDATGGNFDQLDGQSCYNQARKAQATALLNFITSLQATTGVSDIISVGDYNAYGQEDPIDVLLAGGLVNLLPNSYSYVFDGQSGSLDHAFVSGSLSGKIMGAEKWHINADEPIFKDYNQEFNPAYAYSAGPYRSSDHDPVLVGLSLSPAVNQFPVTSVTSPSAGTSFVAGGTITIQSNATDADGTIKKVLFYAGATLLGQDATAPYQFVWTGVEPGSYNLYTKAIDNLNATTTSAVANITVQGCNGGGGITRELFADIPGAAIANLTGNAKYPDFPDFTSLRPDFEGAPNAGDHYGSRMLGFICAPSTGDYTFWIAADDRAELWLSTDATPANKQLIASVPQAVNPRAYAKYPSQKSALVHLVKGARYFVMSLHKEATSNDHLSVAWTLPSGLFQSPLPGSNLSPWTGGPVAREEEGMENGVDAFAGMHVSPIPAQDHVNVSFFSEQGGSTVVSVTDMLSHIVTQTTLQALRGGNAIQLSLEGIASGVYLVNVASATQKLSQKIVIATR